MTEFFSKNMTPDSITGMIFAAEGIKNAVTLLNGPMGCKFYHSTTSKFLSVRPLALLPDENGRKTPVDYNYLNNFFFRQERVPCTYLDSDDYVYGTAQKVETALEYLKKNLYFDVLVIVNSPGASLIGDNLAELAQKILPDKPRVVLESPGFSESFDHGYENAALEILKQIPMDGKKEPSDKRAVNILGLSIWDRYNEGDVKELRRILSLCGIKINCCLCSSCSLDEIRKIPQADLNLVINPRCGAMCASYLKAHYGMESYICDALPIGFDETERLCKDLCSFLGTDPSPLLKESEAARALSWYKINDIYQMCGKPDGAFFAVSEPPALALGLCRFFMSYLGMYADAVEITSEMTLSQEAFAKELFEEYAASDALKKNILDTKAELVFSNANTLCALMLKDRPFSAIETSLPGMGYTDLIPKAHLGINGALFLTEQVLNGLMSRI